MVGARWRALAKTGTAPTPLGGTDGIAVVLTSADAPEFGVVVVAPGAAGRDAAAIAGEILAREISRPEPPPSLRVGAATAKGYTVRRVTVEDYVAQAVQGEAPADAPAALRQSLAILARTFGLASRDRHAHDGFDVCDLTHCQVLRTPREEARSAARATVGEVLSWEGRLADVFYTASCGGTSEAASLVWPQRAGAWPAFLASRPDPAAAPGVEVTWTSELDASQVIAALRGAGLRGDRFQSLAVSERTPSGRAKTLVAEGFTPPTVAAEAFRISAGRALGWQHVKSTWFEIQPSARGVQMTGRGLGHGVGLCVRGARVMAARGASPDAILRAYFPGTLLADVATLPARPVPAEAGRRAEPAAGDAGRSVDTEPGIRLVLPRADEPERLRVLHEIRRALDAVLVRLPAASAPAAVTVRFHPTVASYQRVTRRPWWTSGSTTQRRVELLPLSALESQHQLDRTLRHELVHVLTDDVLGTRPLWVREGLAEYLAQPPGLVVVDEQALPECPDDETFSAARSAADLADLYGRAASCVGAQLRQGRRWDEISYQPGTKH